MDSVGGLAAKTAAQYFMKDVNQLDRLTEADTHQSRAQSLAALCLASRELLQDVEAFSQQQSLQQRQAPTSKEAAQFLKFA